MANEVEMWNKVMAGAMSIPGVKVNRAEYLTSTLMSYCDVEQLKKIKEGKRPVDFLSMDQLDKLANGCISNHTTKVTAVSAATGLPGGWTIAATIPADMAQYYYHVFVLSQKLAYIYGFPDLVDENGNLSEDAQNTLTLFVGSMMGVALANEGIQKLAERFAGQVIKRLPKYALTKTVIYPIVKKIAKWLGIKLTKESFAKGLGKAIPIVGAAISGGLTYATFKPGAKRLQKVLKDSAETMKKSAVNGSDAEFANYTEV